MSKKEEFDKLVSEATDTKEKLFLSAVYLFSIKGYSNVGIRELTGSLGIKESSFYNHYKNKESLLQEIFKRYVNYITSFSISDNEIEEAATDYDVASALEWIFGRFNKALTHNRLFYTLLLIIKMECYTNESAADIARMNIYRTRREVTVKLLNALQKKGKICVCDYEQVTVSLYYGIMGIAEEFLLLEIWDKDLNDQYLAISRHVQLIADFLKTDA